MCYWRVEVDKLIRLFLGGCHIEDFDFILRKLETLKRFYAAAWHTSLGFILIFLTAYWKMDGRSRDYKHRA